MPKLSVSISRVSVDGLKLMILSAGFLLNFVGWLTWCRSIHRFLGCSELFCCLRLCWLPMDFSPSQVHLERSLGWVSWWMSCSCLAVHCLLVLQFSWKRWVFDLGIVLRLSTSISVMFLRFLGLSSQLFRPGDCLSCRIRMIPLIPLFGSQLGLLHRAESIWYCFFSQFDFFKEVVSRVVIGIFVQFLGINGLEVCVVFNDIIRCSRVVVKVWLVWDEFFPFLDSWIAHFFPSCLSILHMLLGAFDYANPA